MDFTYQDFIEIARSPMVSILALLIGVAITYYLMKTFSGVSKKEDVKKGFDYVNEFFVRKTDYEHKEEMSQRIHEDLQKSIEMLTKLTQSNTDKLNSHGEDIAGIKATLRAS